MPQYDFSSLPDQPGQEPKPEPAQKYDFSTLPDQPKKPTQAEVLAKHKAELAKPLNVPTTPWDQFTHDFFDPKHNWESLKTSGTSLAGLVHGAVVDLPGALYESAKTLRDLVNPFTNYETTGRIIHDVKNLPAQIKESALKSGSEPYQFGRTMGQVGVQPAVTGGILRNAPRVPLSSVVGRPIQAAGWATRHGAFTGFAPNAIVPRHLWRLERAVGRGVESLGRGIAETNVRVPRIPTPVVQGTQVLATIPEQNKQEPVVNEPIQGTEAAQGYDFSTLPDQPEPPFESGFNEALNEPQFPELQNYETGFPESELDPRQRESLEHLQGNVLTGQSAPPTDADWWIDKGLRIGPPIIGMALGGPLGGGIGGAVGDYAAQAYSGEEYNPWETVVAGGLGAIPPIFGPARYTGGGLLNIAKQAARHAGSGAVEGGLISGAATPFQHWAQTGSFDAPFSEYAQNIGGGALFGAGTGGLVGGYQGWRGVGRPGRPQVLGAEPEFTPRPGFGAGGTPRDNGPFGGAPRGSGGSPGQTITINAPRLTGQVDPIVTDPVNPNLKTVNITEPNVVPPGSEVASNGLTVTIRDVQDIAHWEGKGFTLVPGLNASDGNPIMVRNDVVHMYGVKPNRSAAPPVQQQPTPAPVQSAPVTPESTTTPASVQPGRISEIQRERGITFTEAKTIAEQEASLVPLPEGRASSTFEQRMRDATAAQKAEGLTGEGIVSIPNAQVTPTVVARLEGKYEFIKQGPTHSFFRKMAADEFGGGESLPDSPGGGVQGPMFAPADRGGSGGVPARYRIGKAPDGEWVVVDSHTGQIIHNTNDPVEARMFRDNYNANARFEGDETTGHVSQGGGDVYPPGSKIDVFDPNDGIIIQTFNSEAEARAFIDQNNAYDKWDYDAHNPNFLPNAIKDANLDPADLTEINGITDIEVARKIREDTEVEIFGASAVGDTETADYFNRVLAAIDKKIAQLEAGTPPQARDVDPNRMMGDQFGPRPEVPPQDKWDEPTQADIERIERENRTVRPEDQDDINRLTTEEEAILARDQWRDIELNSFRLEQDAQSEYAARMINAIEFKLQELHDIETAKNGFEIKQQTEYGSKRWGIYLDGKLKEGGFSTRRAAFTYARGNYGKGLDPTDLEIVEKPDGTFAVVNSNFEELHITGTREGAEDFIANLPPQQGPVPGERGELQSYKMPHDSRPLANTEVGKFILETRPTGNENLDAAIRRMKEIVQAELTVELLEEFRQLGAAVSRDPNIPVGWKDKWRRSSSAQPGEDTSKWTSSEESDRNVAAYDKWINEPQTPPDDSIVELPNGWFGVKDESGDILFRLNTREEAEKYVHAMKLPSNELLQFWKHFGEEGGHQQLVDEITKVLRSRGIEPSTADIPPFHVRPLYSGWDWDDTPVSDTPPTAPTGLREQTQLDKIGGANASDLPANPFSPTNKWGVQPPLNAPDEGGGLRHPTAQRWDAYMRELDAEKAPDVKYRDIMSTASKNKLKRGETWRGRVLKGIEYFESTMPREEPPPQLEKISQASTEKTGYFEHPPSIADITFDEWGLPVHRGPGGHLADRIQRPMEMPDEGGYKKPKWTDRPERLPLRGDEQIPDMAFQPDEGKATNREYLENFLPSETTFNPTSREEINSKTEKDPEEIMDEIVLVYPNILDEAKAIYRENDPEKIVENFKRILAEEQVMWPKYNKAQDDRMKSNIPIPEELITSSNRIWRLKALAQAKYERAATRIVSGEQHNYDILGAGIGDEDAARSAAWSDARSGTQPELGLERPPDVAPPQFDLPPQTPNVPRVGQDPLETNQRGLNIQTPGKWKKTGYTFADWKQLMTELGNRKGGSLTHDWARDQLAVLTQQGSPGLRLNPRPSYGSGSSRHPSGYDPIFRDSSGKPIIHASITMQGGRPKIGTLVADVTNPETADAMMELMMELRKIGLPKFDGSISKHTVNLIYRMGDYLDDAAPAKLKRRVYRSVRDPNTGQLVEKMTGRDDPNPFVTPGSALADPNAVVNALYSGTGGSLPDVIGEYIRNSGIAPEIYQAIGEGYGVLPANYTGVLSRLQVVRTLSDGSTAVELGAVSQETFIDRVADFLRRSAQSTTPSAAPTTTPPAAPMPARSGINTPEALAAIIEGYIVLPHDSVLLGHERLVRRLSDGSQVVDYRTHAGTSYTTPTQGQTLPPANPFPTVMTPSQASSATLPETRIDVFDPNVGVTIRTFDSQAEADAFMASHPAGHRLDSSPHDPNALTMSGPASGTATPPAVPTSGPTPATGPVWQYSPNATPEGLIPLTSLARDSPEHRQARSEGYMVFSTATGLMPFETVMRTLSDGSVAVRPAQYHPDNPNRRMYTRDRNATGRR